MTMTRLLVALVLTMTFTPNVAIAADFEAPYNTAQWIEVIVTDSSDAGITGKLYTDMTVYYKEGISGTWTALNLSATSCTASSGNWCQEDSANVPGAYRVYVPATVTDTKGPLQVIAKCSACKTYWTNIQV